MSSDVSFQVDGVANRVALGVIIEISKNISAVGELLLDPFRVLLQRMLRVATAIMVAVKSQVNPVGGNSPRMIFDHVMNTQGGIMALQNDIYVIT